MGASLVMFYCRGSRLHYGIDINCDAGSSVHSPFSAQVIRISRAYGNGKPHDTHIYMDEMVVKVHCGTVLGAAYLTWRQIRPPKQPHDAL